MENFGISLVNRAFNVQAREWPRIIFAWLMRFLYRSGFVIGWTFIIALFVSHFGISSLPYLFVINAAFVLMGSFFFSILLDRYKHKSIMLVTLVITISLLAFSLVFVHSNELVFFSVVLVSMSIFLSQFRILLVGFVEEMFTPRESERAFPLIEAAETFGGVVAGLSIIFLSSVLSTHQFIYIWGAFLLVLFGMLYWSNLVVNKVYVLEDNEIDEEESVFKRVSEAFKSVSHGKFIKGLFLIVFFNWLLFNLLEFQYTKAVYDNLGDVVLESGSGFENIFIHDLGALFAIFSAVALVVQLFVASRLIKFLGVIGSMLLHPVVSFLSFLGISFFFNFRTAVLMKTNFTVTTMIQHDAYHSAYYAVKKNLRSYIHELSEGVVRPLGAITGTLVLIGLQALFPEDSDLILSINVAMMVVALILMYVTYREQDIYTESALHDLLNENDRTAQLEAVDILSGKGHKASIPVLRDILKDEARPLSLRLRILEALGELEDIDLITDIIDCFDSPRSSLRSTALDVLLGYKDLGRETAKNLFFEVRLVNALKDMYRNESKEEISSKIVILMAKISPVIAFDFILQILDAGDDAMKPHAIYALGSYASDEIVDYVKPYLESGHADLQANAAVALGRFTEFRKEILWVLDNMIDSSDPRRICAGLYAIGELKFTDRVDVCFAHLTAENIGVRMASAFALLKLGRAEAVEVIVELLMKAEASISWRVQTMLKNMSGRLVRRIDKLIKSEAYVRIAEILMGVNSFESLDLERLKELRRLYCLLEAFSEVEAIDLVIESMQDANN